MSLQDPGAQVNSPPGLIAMNVVIPVLATAAVALRFQLRTSQRSKMKVDDWIMLPALLVFWGMCITVYLGVARRVWGYTTFDHARRAEPNFRSDVSYEGRLWEAFQYLQILCLGLIKLGALLFYRRLFCVLGARTCFDWAVVSLSTLTVIWIVSMTIMNSVQCGAHIAALWTSGRDYVKYCIYTAPYEEGFAISDFLLDFLILLLPIPKIWTLHTSKTNKAAISGVFALALVSFAGSIARMVLYIQLAAGGTNPYADGWILDTVSVFWSILEAGLSIIAINLPSLWGYTKEKSRERIFKSFRSWMSLTSLRKSSRGSDASETQSERNLREKGMPGWYGHPATRTSDDDDRTVVEKHEGMHAEARWTPVKTGWSPPDAIMVNHNFSQSDSIV